MATDYQNLPKDPESLVTILANHVQAGERMMATHVARWTIADLYLNMVRDFSVVNFSTGRIQGRGVFDVDAKTGEIKYTHQQLLAQFDRIRSRFASLDVSPKIEAKAQTLQTLRQRGVAQVLADSVRHPPHIERINDQLSIMFCLYGCAGLSASLKNHDAVGLGADFEVIPPWELFPYPLLGRDPTKQQGLLRRRFVSEAFVIAQFGARAFRRAKKDGKLRSVRIRFGRDPNQITHSFTETDTSAGFATSRTALTKPVGRGGRVSEKTELEVYEITEAWFDGPFDTLDRYIVKVSDWIAVDEDLSKTARFCPIGYGQFVNAGRFWGYGVPDILMPANRWAERLLQRVFQNVEEADRFGFLVMPPDMGNDEITARDVGFGLRVIKYTPDPYGANVTPTVVQPATTGAFPGQIAQLALSIQQSLLPESPLAGGQSAFRRAADFQSISLIDEQARQTLSNAQSAYARIWGTVDRSLVSDVARTFERGELVSGGGRVTTTVSVPVSRIDESILGVVIQNDGRIDLSMNPLPNPAALDFTIRDRNPRSQTARKGEALGLLKAGMTSPDAVELLGIDESLDFAIWNPDKKNTARRTKLNIITLFGDGQFSDRIIVNPDVEIPSIAIRILQSFMASPEFQLADPAIQNEFFRYLNLEKSLLQPVLPEGLPSLNDLASTLSPAPAPAPASAPS